MTTFTPYDEMDRLLSTLPYPLKAVSGMYLKRKDLRERPAPDDRDAPLPEHFAWGMRELYSLTVKMVGILLCADYVRQPTDRELNTRILRLVGQRATTEGNWTELLLGPFEQESKTRLRQKGLLAPRPDLFPAGPFVSELRGWLNEPVVEILERLLACRNALTHGHIGDSDREALAFLNGFETDLDALLMSLQFLARYDLVCQTTNQGLWRARGDRFQLIAAGSHKIEDESEKDSRSGKATPKTKWTDRMVLVRQTDHTRLLLYPWILVTIGAGSGATVRFNDTPLYDMGAAFNPHYITYIEGERFTTKKPDQREFAAAENPSYRDFTRLMNEIEAKAEIGKQQDNRFERVFRELIDDHLQRSLFEGRENELNELAEIANTKEGYYRLGGFAGQGKTALIARLHRQVEPKNPAGQIWLWHFCGRTDQRNSGYRFMVSMLSQLSKKAGGAFGGAEWEGKGLEELFREFGDLLGKAQAATGQKLILVIDALDEAAAPGEYALPNCLPRELPKGCCAIITNRLDKDGRSLIDLGRLVNQVNDLRPLQNLPAQTVHRVLERLETELAQKDNRDPVEIPNELAQAVYARIAQGHALFLRAMVDAIRAGDIVIDDISTYPESLNDYFDTIWNDLPTAHNLLAQRFLLTLAVLREYAWDDLMAQILVESYRPTEEAGRRPSLDPELIEQTRLALSKWLVVRDEGGSARYQLFHDLFRDYVFSIVRTDEVKGQHKMVADYCVGWERPAPRRINDEIVEPDYPEFVRPEWRKFRELPDPLSGAEREFALANLPYHLLQAGQWDELFETLTNFQFMEDKITHVGATEKEENGRVTRVYEGVNLLLDDYQDALAVFPRN